MPGKMNGTQCQSGRFWSEKDLKTIKTSIHVGHSITFVVFPFAFYMAKGTRKIQVKPTWQIVHWESINTSRGIKRHQVPILTQTPRSAPSTPTTVPGAPEMTQDFNDHHPIPINLTSTNVWICII